MKLDVAVLAVRLHDHLHLIHSVPLQIALKASRLDRVLQLARKHLLGERIPVLDLHFGDIKGKVGFAILLRKGVVPSRGHRRVLITSLHRNFVVLDRHFDGQVPKRSRPNAYRRLFGKAATTEQKQN